MVTPQQMKSDDELFDLFSTKHLDLPPILPQFFVPRLPDEPHDPITADYSPREAYKPKLLPSPPLHPISPILEHFHGGTKLGLKDVWADAARAPQDAGSSILSWDTLRPTTSRLTSPFLSEQDSYTFSAVRYHIDPPVLDGVLYLSEKELFHNLRMSVLGVSSPIHTWDQESEKFIVRGDKSIIIERKDASISRSIVKRFLTIGTLLRRLEYFLQTLRSAPGRAKDGPTLHAFCHSMDTVLEYIRSRIEADFPENTLEGLTTMWTRLSSVEDLLSSLAAFCGRDETNSPETYPKFDAKPQPLLSQVYNYLETHLDRFSPRIIIAVFAYLLTHSSQHYLSLMCSSVGYHDGSPPTSRHEALASLPLESGGDDEGDLPPQEDGDDDYMLPFLPSELKAVLPNAQKSLKLLRAADSEGHSQAVPDRLLVSIAQMHRMGWVWTEKEIEHSYMDGNEGHDASSDVNVVAVELVEEHAKYGETSRDALDEFRIFDLQPGSQLALLSTQDGSTSNDAVRTSSALSGLLGFISAFPETLPSITPTLPLLTSHIFMPLVQHAASLSMSLLSLYLTPPSPTNPSPHLDFRAHLSLLQSYLLITSHAFKSRLTAALFSDAEEHDDGGDHSSTILGIRAHKPDAKPRPDTEKPWAVGLAPSLTERETWPPFGTDLSFSLRTVIVDSLSETWSGRYSTEGSAFEADFYEEAENRLGFAVRELEVEDGKSGWMNPFSIEALDFLYMDYKPPRTMDVLITPVIISKYQRIFTLRLRIMRVENALNATFRMSGKLFQPIFSTLAQANKQLLHFRFIAHSFVSSLSSYITDTVIKSNFDFFEKQLVLPSPLNISSAMTRSGSTPTSFQLPFSDVFALSEAHSRLMNNILSACLLRSGQRHALELISEVLEMTLRFAVMVGRMKKGYLEEYRAAMMVEDMLKEFKAKMRMLVKVLKALVARGGGGASDVVGIIGGGSSSDLLNHFIIKLTMNEWWSASDS